MREEQAFIWQMAWQRAFGLAFLELGFVAIFCYIPLVVLFYRKGHTGDGILCTVCLVVPGLQPFGILLGLIFGWLRASKWGLRAYMAVWTGIVVLAVLNLVTSQVLLHLDESTMEALFGQENEGVR